MATNSFVQVPPDSTGKKLYTQQHSVEGNDVQAHVYHLGCAEHPDHIQLVDAQGQAFTRFAEGSPTMDAFGNLRTSSARVLGAYEYTNSDMADLFQDTTSTGGSITWQQSASQTLMQVTSASGSSVIRTTNRYHYYQPGVGNLVIITLAQGDTGKANNVRKWGYFDEQDGIYWELNGTTLNVVLRSSVSGSVVEQRIPQASWNGDKLDGSGISDMTIDLTKANFYFIDYAWLGVGPVRFGVLSPNGARWVCHTFQNPNNNSTAYMRTGSLPVRYENTNTGATASTTDMKTICAAVYSESTTNYTYWRYPDIEATSKTVTTDTPILSMRVAAGVRAGIYPETLNVVVSGGNVKLTIMDDATLTGATWLSKGEGMAEGDVTATAIDVEGVRFKSWYVAPGIANINLAEFYETNDEAYHRLADDSGSYVFTLLATKLDGTTVNVGATLNYRVLA